MSPVVVVILSWNRIAVVLDCIARVKAQDTPVTIVVVDNGSSDDSVSRIRTMHDDVTVLEEAVNTGFVGGVNRGLAEADRLGATHAWLLNDDTIFEPTTLGGLLGASQDSPCGLLTPGILDLDGAGEVQFANGLVDVRDAVLKHNYGEASYKSRITSGSIPVIPGTAMLCDMRVYRAIGPFDPRYFAYWEDIDYCVRAARAGFGSHVASGVWIRHESQGGRNGRAAHFCYYMVRNEWLFMRLHLRGEVLGRWRRRWFADSLEWVAEARNLGLMENAEACIDGMWDAVRHREGPRASHPPAPRVVRRLLLVAPYLLCDLARGHYRAVFRRVTGVRP